MSTQLPLSMPPKPPAIPPDIGYFDGACEPTNPGGTGSYGFIIHDLRKMIVAKDKGLLKARPSMTNNVAEYTAAGMAVKAYKETGRRGPLLLRGDSQLVIEQMCGRWRVANPDAAYVRYHNRLKELLTECTFEVVWEWVPREQNAIADRLSVEALEAVGIRRRERR